MNRLLSVILGTLFLLLTACKPSGGNVVSKTDEGARADADITLLVTTDIHGEMLPYNFLTDRRSDVSMANIMSYVREVRKENPDGTILLDNGDLIEGTTPMYYYNYIGIREPHLAAQVMNYMGYDAINLGNHDLEGGEQIYRSHLRYQYQMPWLCANAIDQRTAQPMFKPYTIIERKGYRIAVLGLVTSEVPNWLPSNVIPHLSFQGMMEAALVVVPYIEQTEKPDLIIGLFHAGKEEVQRNASPQNHNSRKQQKLSYTDGSFPVANAIRGFDVMLIGHDHRTYQNFMVNSFGDTIPVLEPASHGKEIGRIDIHLRDKRKANGHVEADYTLSRVSTQDYPADPDYMAHFDGQIDKIKTFLDRPIGTIDHTLDGQSGLVGPSNLTNLIHSVQLSVSNADISMACCLSNHIDIEEGDLSMRQLFSIYKYENQMQELWMYGYEVQKFLEYGYGKQFNQMHGPHDHLLNFQLDMEGKVQYNDFGPVLATPQYNFTSAAGINYEVDVQKPAGHRVKILSMADGREFDPNRKYFVVMSSFQAAGGGGFLPIGLGWTAEDIRTHTNNSTRQDMRFFIKNYIRKYGEESQRPLGTWRVVPQAWWNEAKQRDIDLLIPYLRR